MRCLYVTLAEKIKTKKDLTCDINLWGFVTQYAQYAGNVKNFFVKTGRNGLLLRWAMVFRVSCIIGRAIQINVFDGCLKGQQIKSLNSIGAILPGLLFFIIRTVLDSNHFPTVYTEDDEEQRSVSQDQLKQVLGDILSESLNMERSWEGHSN